MPPKANTKLPQLPWNMDGAKHTWNLIALVDRGENRKVLVGKNKSKVF